VQKVDKYGHTVNKQDNTMKQFYQIKDAKESKPADSKYYDEDGKFKWDAQSSSEDEEDGGGSDE
jgi:hypothetical protein